MDVDPLTTFGANALPCTGSFGVVLHAELRGSAVALKSLRSSKAKLLHSSVRSTTTNGSKTANTSRYTKGAAFAFIDSSYSTVEDEERRGLLRLQRAFEQASRSVMELETARKKEHEAVLL